MIQFFPAISSTTAALTAERTRLEIVAQNIANANTTRGLDGKPYQRQQVVFENALNQAQLEMGSAPGTLSGPQTRVQKDARPGSVVLRPGHPDANKQGLVAMPNVNVYEEMADMIAASRSFEANLAVMRNSRSLAMQALNIGRR
jgi:flagellar basal-body rod protein FlgC